MKKTQNIVLLSAAVLLATQSVGGTNHNVAAKEKSISYTVSKKRVLPKVAVNLKPLPVKHFDQPFKDISQSIYKNYISEIYRRGITTGYTPTTYNPNANVTRGEMAVFLHRLAGTPAYTPPFNVYTDVNQYKNQILWLTAANISNGTAPHYTPNGTVTRGQMVAFLHRMAVVSGKASASEKYDAYFADSKKHMFANDIGWARSQGITTGYTPKLFKPDTAVSRGEMAAFLYRFYNKMNKKYPVDQTSITLKDSTITKAQGAAFGDKDLRDNITGLTNQAGENVLEKEKANVKITAKSKDNKDVALDKLTQTEGTYTVTYSYSNKTATATVNVVKDH
ncbi:S-layer homology domain-containing protein [Lactococcus garvieae]|uniref:S-layer homology domain-containing protein n=1 Tax=Lactococcus garvieae TaxID=1363 RepID=UPI003D77EAEF